MSKAWMRNRQIALSTILKDDTLSGFEKRAYEAVSRIPPGEVRSYKWVAKEAGSPNAFRAVGNALNKNKRTDIVPCHRVIRSDGSLGGYAKGMAAKRKLLISEGLDVR